MVASQPTPKWCVRCLGQDRPALDDLAQQLPAVATGANRLRVRVEYAEASGFGFDHWRAPLDNAARE